MKEILFGKRRWAIRPTARGGPGPNLFDERNVTVQPNGGLKLEVVQRGGAWTSAELQTVERLGLGTYQLWLVGRPDLLDPQLVFGFFPYPTPDVGPDGTHEIDIEFARWGEKDKPCGNFTVCPTTPGKPSTTHPYSLTLTSELSTHRIVRTAQRIIFSSYSGHRALQDSRDPLAHWEFADELSPAAMPLHLNFWLFRGKAPQNNQSASLVIQDFTFVPSAGPRQ